MNQSAMKKIILQSLKETLFTGKQREKESKREVIDNV